MYTNDLPRTKIIISPSPSTSIGEKPTTVLTPPATPSDTEIDAKTPIPLSNGYAKASSLAKTPYDVSERELSQIAAEFAGKVPGDLFSPAEIQGFLLKRKKDPKKAVVEVEAWVEGMVEQKRKGTKLMGVQ